MKFFIFGTKKDVFSSKINTLRGESYVHLMTREHLKIEKKMFCCEEQGFGLYNSHADSLS